MKKQVKYFLVILLSILVIFAAYMAGKLITLEELESYKFKNMVSLKDSQNLKYYIEDKGDTVIITLGHLDGSTFTRKIYHFDENSMIKEIYEEIPTMNSITLHRLKKMNPEYKVFNREFGYITTRRTVPVTEKSDKKTLLDSYKKFNEENNTDMYKVEFLNK